MGETHTRPGTVRPRSVSGSKIFGGMRLSLAPCDRNGCAPRPEFPRNGGHSEVESGGVLLSHTVSSAVPSALSGLASGFGM